MTLKYQQVNISKLAVYVSYIYNIILVTSWEWIFWKEKQPKVIALSPAERKCLHLTASTTFIYAHLNQYWEHIIKFVMQTFLISILIIISLKNVVIPILSEYILLNLNFDD